MKAALPPNEELRLAALKTYDILDSGCDQTYDDFTELASFIAGTPFAVISIVDRDRQWFKSRVGLDVEETPREVSFCAHAILTPDQPLHVQDATKDKRFADNPFVTGEAGIRFYFGAPLVCRDNFALGTLCVVDNKPRVLSPAQIVALNALARQVVTALEVRKCVVSLAKVVAAQHNDMAEHKKAMDEVDSLTHQLESLLHKKRQNQK